MLSASRLLTEDESVLLLDVRELAEYETVHLPNSLLIRRANSGES